MLRTAGCRAPLPLAKLRINNRSWGDLSDSDSDDQHWEEEHSGGLIGQFSRATTAEEKKPPAADELRTPLRITASLFVPGQSPSASTPGKVSVPVSEPHPVQTAAPPGEHTTVMLRNLPCGISRSALVWLLDKQGFAGQYDFVYLPIDFKKGACLGYAFINLTSPQEVKRFTEHFEGFRSWPIKSWKVCSVGLSETQGLEANVERYRNSPLMGDEVADSYKPAVFVAGKRVPFASPTRPLRPMERRR